MLNLRAGSTDTVSMQALTAPYLAVPYLAFGAALMRALLVRAEVLPPTCAHCGLRYERRHLGERVCRCH
jgi:hypothetical protein